MADDLTKHLRIFEPHPGLFAYYDGRVAGHRFAPGRNWVDEGALALGIATYALVDGAKALVYDSHVSVGHGRAIRQHLEGQGVTEFTLVYSHCHLDHIAGSQAFGEVAIIANARTARHLARDRTAIEAGTLSGPPAIAPLSLPTRIFSGRLTLDFGRWQVQLIEVNIHSDDATVLWLEGPQILLAGDTVEDCATYVGAPEDFATHQADLARLMALKPRFVLPDHGAPEVIAAGGYGPELLAATARYSGWLQRLAVEPELRGAPLEEVIGADLAAGILRRFAPYEVVHAQNIARTLAAFGQGQRPGR